MIKWKLITDGQKDGNFILATNINWKEHKPVIVHWFMDDWMDEDLEYSHNNITHYISLDDLPKEYE